MSGFRAPGTPIPATPPLHGLQVSAEEVRDPDRWDLGFTIHPENCVDLSGFATPCESYVDGVAPVNADPPEVIDGYDVLPFTIESSFRCNAAGFQTVDYAGRARRQLEAGTSKFMEFELWTGTLQPDNPHLASASATVLGSGAAFPTTQAFTLLGQALSNCAHGGRGMLHAPTFIVDKWLMDSGTAMKESGNRLVTVNRGDVIVSGTGYPGTGPGGIAPGVNEAWVYATGPVQYRLGDITVNPPTLAEAMDRRRNLIAYHAQRDAAVNFDPCCHFAILVQFGTTSDEEIGS
jgi:hypothetical protein